MQPAQPNNNIENILKKVPQYTWVKIKRHLISLIKHSTPGKLINLAAIEFQRKIRRKKIWGYPYYILFEPGNICNLRCPLCLTGLQAGGRKKQFVKFQDFKKIIDRLAPYAYEIGLQNWGEPFLNPDIFSMIRYCTDKNIGTNLSSNMNIGLLDAEAIVKSGLEYLVVSLDGTTQDVYAQYRANGKIDLVLENVKNLVQKKKQLKSKLPFIDWQFIVMKHNYHQIDQAREMALQLGVDTIRFIPVVLPFDADNKRELAERWFPYLPDDYQNHYRMDTFMQKPIEGGCFYLYRNVTINPLGAIAPCCYAWNEKDDFGNMLTHNFADIWNNKSYQKARALFTSKNKAPSNTICDRCPIFAKPKHNS